MLRRLGSSIISHKQQHNTIKKCITTCYNKNRYTASPRPFLQKNSSSSSSSSSVHWFSTSSSWNWSSSSKDDSSSIIDSGPSPNSDVNTQVQTEVLNKCTSLYSSLQPINEKLHGPLPKQSNNPSTTSLPFVFLVGNHSSGKSSFINYILGRTIQTAGVAPTDDSFTVIAPGPQDDYRDGPGLIGDPDMGFSSLRQFGPTLIHHTQLKIRPSNLNFMLIDSPGMIDSPTREVMDRGYDFQGVVRWFAQRADVVLLFFDPDKPGTTGETLSVLLHSLGGMDHKLLIVLNKADQFLKIHDFARAYGSLCWNLSKVIPRKDLPKIYTMCLPQSPSTSPNQIPSPALADLYQTRDEVVSEVFKAPKRRIDNVITHLNDSVQMLLMHTTICKDVKERFDKIKFGHLVQQVGMVVSGLSLSAGGLYMELPLQFTGGVMTATILGTASITFLNSRKLKEVEANFLTKDELSASFQRTHAREVSEGDEFTSSLWARISDSLRVTLKNVGLAEFPGVDKRDVRDLRHILDVEIPNLRRIASPLQQERPVDEEGKSGS